MARKGGNIATTKPPIEFIARTEWKERQLDCECIKILWRRDTGRQYIPPCAVVGALPGPAGINEQLYKIVLQNFSLANLYCCAQKTHRHSLYTTTYHVHSYYSSPDHHPPPLVSVQMQLHSREINFHYQEYRSAINFSV